MRIESIKIENYRQYKGPVEIEFSVDEDKNFTIIQGTNGAGKTNLLNSITWCFYGKELHKSQTTGKGPIYNLITKNQTKPNENFDVKVEVTLVDEYDFRIICTRSLNFRCDSKGEIFQDPHGSNFQIYQEMQDENLTRPELFVNNNLPIDIEGYFFFDGEKLEDYFDVTSKNSIKDSVYQLSQLHLLDSALSNLEMRRKEYVRDLNKLDKNTGKFLTDRNNLESKMRVSLKKRNKIDSEIETLNTELIELKKELRQADNKDVSMLERERTRLQKDEQRLIKNIDKTKEKKEKFLVKNVSFVLGFPALKYGSEICDSDNEELFNSLYSPEFLEHILNKKQCICGCDLSENDDAYHHLEHLMESVSNLNNVFDKVKDSSREFNTLLIELEDFKRNLNSINEDISIYEEDLMEVREDLKFNQYNFEGIDKSKIKKLNEEILEKEELKSTKISERTKADIDYKDAVSKLERLERMERDIKIRDKKVLLLNNKNAFCTRAIKQIEKLKGNLSENIRSQVEDLTTSQFKKLMWKDNFEEVLVSRNYDVKVKDVVGEISSPGILSAGEKLVLALSFVSALNNISGFYLPFIIDTPMGRLGSEMKNNISKTLPEYMEGRQVTLLVTDEEYNENFKLGIAPKVGKEYYIKVNESKEGTHSEVVLNDR